jgi:cellulose synthase/poly-beta-1,6-N-acetylglucosamine synthase-like glycosyltransferase
VLGSWSTAALVLYLGVLSILSLNGVHRLWLLWSYRRRRQVIPRADIVHWPVVTVQLPVFNERYVVDRLIRACAQLDYPHGLLEIQVLDDSTDDTTAMARAVVEELAAAGVDVHLIHRHDRAGFKAGALEAGMAVARGELIAVFDADFMPPAGFLRDTVPHMVDGVGMVQARWGHLNQGASWLTAAQATLLDGHFVVEHTARWASGRWFNFNGTAGVWRRQAIEDGGGWQHDTLTEDLDLSYRCQLAGWRFVYLVDVVAPAELPSTMAAFRAQQHRWAKGSIQTGKKLLRRIWAAPVPVPIKVEATAHLTANLSYPLLLLLSLLLPWAVAARIGGAASSLLAIDLVLFTAAMVPFVAYYSVAVLGSGSGNTARRLLMLPVALALGLGLAVSQTRAVAEGLFGPVGVFVRTPKAGGTTTPTYRATLPGARGLEVGMAGYLLVACVAVGASGYLASLPFLGLFTLGYGLVAVESAR